MSFRDHEGAPHYTRGQLAMLLLGAIMLLPGVCALVFFVGAMWEMVSKGQSFGRMDGIMQMILVVWVISLAIAAAGIALIFAARRRARTPG